MYYICNKIEKDYLKFLSSKLGKELMNIFNNKIKQKRNLKITNIKKIDFKVRQTRKLNNKV